jgi:hypothetical protein
MIMRASLSTFAAVFLGIQVQCGLSHGEVLHLKNKAQWQSAVGSFQTITFTEYYPPQTIISRQYAPMGLSFIDGLYFTAGAGSFINDGAGLYAFGPGPEDDYIIISAKESLFAIAVDYPGFLEMSIYSGQTLVYATDWQGGGGQGNFRGLISSEPFDYIILHDPIGGIAVDDLFFSDELISIGACCLLNQSCEDARLEWPCLAQGGVYQGDGTTCDGPPCGPPCHEDANEDGLVNVADLLAVIISWGACPAPCPLSCDADVNFNCTVNTTDLLAVIGAWGACQ